MTQLQIIVLIIGVLIYASLSWSLVGKMASQDDISRRLRTLEDLGTPGSGSVYEDDRSFMARVVIPTVEGIAQKISIVIPVSDDARAQLADTLRLAGWHITVPTYLGMVFIVAVLAMIIFGSAMGAMGFVLGPLAVYSLSRFAMKRGVSNRTVQLERALPDTLDLLSSCVTAGLGFDQGLAHVVQRTEGPLTDELSQTQREIAMGVDRSEALTHMATRCNSRQVSAFASAISQADRLGVPIANILETQALTARENHRMAIEEASAKVPIKMLFPLVLFVFPVIFIILLGPAVVNIMGAF